MEPVKKSNARKTSTSETKVYSYGAFLPKESEQIKLINDQLYFAHKYRNKLVEIERKRRNRFRNLRKLMSPELRQLENDLLLTEEKIIELRKSFGGRAENSLDPKFPKKNRQLTPQAVEIKDLKLKKKDLSAKIKSIHTQLNLDYFKEADSKFSLLKKERLEQKAKELNKDSLGPNDVNRHNVVNNLYKEMIDGGNRFWAIKAKISKSAEASNKRARSNCKCSSGTYVSIEEAAKQSFSNSKFEPKFKSFDGSGKIGMQLTQNKGLSIKDALSGSSPVLKIDLHPEVYLRQNKKKNKVLATARIKLFGTEKTGKFVDIPFIMHRQMPEDATIKWVFLVVSKIGYRSIYNIQFTIESNSFTQPSAIRPDDVAINLGWKVNDQTDDITVATSFDGKNYNELILPSKMRANIVYKETLISHADKHFDSVKKDVSKWLKNSNLDECITKYFTNLPQWRSHKKLLFVSKELAKVFLPDNTWYDLWKKWKTHCKENKPWKNCSDKDDLFTTLDNTIQWCKDNSIDDPNVQMAFYLKTWAEKEIHLINWARGIESKLRKHRKEIYRCFAKKLSSTYGKVIVENWDKSKTAETPDVENDNRTKQEENANAVRQFVGVSVLTDALKQKFGKDFCEENAKNISKEHFKCGGELINQKELSDVHCKKCNKSVNVNYNAAAHLFDRHGERSGAVKLPGTARKTRKSPELLA